MPSYAISGELGRGAMGVVIGGRHSTLDRPVAIKELPDALSRDESVRERFRSEARLLASMDHPHIVPVYDYVEQDGTCLLVMEHLPGGTVWSRFNSDGMSHQASCAVVLATCAALHYAHQREVLHRDVKPENLMFSSEGTLKVTDFGIAKVLSGGSTMATASGDILGTPAYIAPEQALGQDVGPPADVFAAGVMLYELLSGQLPFSDEGGPLAVVFRHAYEDPVPLRSVAPEVPEPVVEVVTKALARDPADRYQTAEEFGVALGEAAATAWGPSWIETADVSIRVSGPIADAASRPTVFTGGPPAPPASPSSPGGAAPSTARSTEMRPGAEGDSRATSAGVGPPPGSVGPGAEGDSRATSAGAGPPPSPPGVMVRPQSGAAHERKARSAELDPDELVAVDDVLEPPPTSAIPAVVAVALLVLTVLLGMVGLGSIDVGGDLQAGGFTLDGTDVVDSASVELDFADSVALEATALPEATEQVRIDFSVAGIPLIASSTETLEEGPAGRSATIDLGANEFLVAGPVQAEFKALGPDGETLGSQRFVAEPASAGVFTLGGLGGLVLVLLVLAYTETFLRPMRRRGARRVSGLIGMAVVGFVFGAAVSVLGWVFADTELVVGSMLLVGLLGAVAGIVIGVTAAQFGRRRRVKQILKAQQLWERRSSWAT